MYPPYIDHCASVPCFTCYSMWDPVLKRLFHGTEGEWLWRFLEAMGKNTKLCVSFRKLRTHANIGGDGAIQQELVIDPQRSEI